jgi:hypothetical protein
VHPWLCFFTHHLLKVNQKFLPDGVVNDQLANQLSAKCNAKVN